MNWAADAYLTESSDLTELKKVVKNLLRESRKRLIRSTALSPVFEDGVKKRSPELALS
ncbi:MAG: hypothetical protein AB1502_06880 [Thermodesulfobacteriota bacterium]